MPIPKKPRPTKKDKKLKEKEKEHQVTALSCPSKDLTLFLKKRLEVGGASHSDSQLLKVLESDVFQLGKIVQKMSLVSNMAFVPLPGYDQKEAGMFYSYMRRVLNDLGTLLSKAPANECTAALLRSSGFCAMRLQMTMRFWFACINNTNGGLGIEPTDFSRVRLIPELTNFVTIDQLIQKSGLVHILPPHQQCAHRGRLDRTDIPDCRVRRAFEVGHRNRTYLQNIRCRCAQRAPCVLTILSCETFPPKGTSGIDRELSLEATFELKRERQCHGIVCLVDEVTSFVYVLHGFVRDRTLTRLPFSSGKAGYPKDLYAFPVPMILNDATFTLCTNVCIVPQTGCLIGLVWSQNPFSFVVWPAIHQKKGRFEPIFLSAELKSSDRKSKMMTASFIDMSTYKNKLIIWGDYNKQIFVYEMFFEEQKIKKLIRLPSDAFRLPAYLPNLGDGRNDAGTAKMQLQVIGRYRRYWICADLQNITRIFACVHASKIGANEQSVLVFDLSDRIMEDCLDIVVKHIQLTRTPTTSGMRCTFANGCMFYWRSFSSATDKPSKYCSEDDGGHVFSHLSCVMIDLSRWLRPTVVCGECGLIEKHPTRGEKRGRDWICELCG